MPHNADGIRTCRRVNGDGSRHINNQAERQRRDDKRNAAAKSRVTHETNIKGMGRAVGTALLTGSIVDLAHRGSPFSALVRRGLTRRSRHAVSQL
jgi:hypothetical protein